MASSDRIEGAVKAFAVLESFDFERQRLNATLTAPSMRSEEAIASVIKVWGGIARLSRK